MNNYITSLFQIFFLQNIHHQSTASVIKGARSPAIFKTILTGYNFFRLKSVS